MTWLDEPAFAPDRSEIASWAVTARLDNDGRCTGLELDGPGTAIARSNGFVIATAGIEPDQCLGQLAGLLAASTLAPVVGGAVATRDRIQAEQPHAWIAADLARGTLVACRDPLGRIGLFWGRGAGGIVFSPDSQRVLELTGLSGEPDPGPLIGQLSGLWGPAEETYIRGVARVPAGRALVMAGDREELLVAWDPVRDVAVGERDLSPGRFREALTESVDMAGEGQRLGIYLSGGLDSVGVAVLAAEGARRTGGPDPLALSVGFGGSDFDEVRTQKAVAGALAIPQLYAEHRALCGGRPIDAVLELASTLPAPPQNVFLPAFITIGRDAVAKGCSAVLTGTGGDEWLGMTPALAADLLWRLDLTGLGRLYGTLHRSHPVGRYRAARTVFWRFGLRLLIGSALAGRGQSRLASAISRARLRQSLASIPDWIAPGGAGQTELSRRLELAHARRPSTPGSIYGEDVRAGLDHVVANVEAEEHVEHGRRIGAPLRHPYLSPGLVELLLSARPGDLTHHGWSKAPLRMLVHDALPELGFDSQRKPVAAGYVAGLMASEGVEAFRRLGGARALGELGVLDARGADALAEAVRSGRASYREPYQLWEILCLEAWARPRLA